MTNPASTIAPAYAGESDRHDPAANYELGFWMYLMSDLVLFAAFFATYAVLSLNDAGGPTEKQLFDLPYVLGETMILLVSSATCGMAVLSLHGKKKSKVIGWLALTGSLGCGFIGMEMNELYRMILKGNGPDRSAFLSAFFTLVGTHGAHVTFGLVWIAIMMIQVSIKGLTISVRSRLLRLSMFWHFLDIVWIGIFTFVYLRGVL